MRDTVAPRQPFSSHNPLHSGPGLSTPESLQELRVTQQQQQHKHRWCSATESTREGWEHGAFSTLALH